MIMASVPTPKIALQTFDQCSTSGVYCENAQSIYKTPVNKAKAITVSLDFCDMML